MREIIFDTETTGLNPLDGDRMVEIGCLEMVGRMLTGRRYHCYYNPGRAMPAAAEAVHGLGDSFLASKSVFAAHADELTAFLGDAPLVAHNAGFDFSFLNMELGRCGRDPVSVDRMVDTVGLARTRFPGAKLSLDALCTRFGIDRSHRTLHGALLDAELLAQVYIELTGGRQIGLALATDTDLAVTVRPAAAIISVRPMRPPRRHSASASELARHRAFVGTMATALWNQGLSRHG